VPRRRALTRCEGPGLDHPLHRGGAVVSTGRFGAYGGRFVPETLMPCLIELERFPAARRTPGSARIDGSCALRSVARAALLGVRLSASPAATHAST
jgi:hypothetical protein